MFQEVLVLTAEEEEEIFRLEQEEILEQQFQERQAQLKKQEREEHLQSLKLKKRNPHTKQVQIETRTPKSFQVKQTSTQVPMHVQRSQVFLTSEFLRQFNSLNQSTQDLIRSRILSICSEDGTHYGDFSSLEVSVSYHGTKTKAFELRWRSGLRVYFVVVGRSILFDRIGTKNSQDKDINKLQREFKKAEMLSLDEEI